MTKRNRLQLLEEKIQSQQEAARAEYFAWWSQFTDSDLLRIADGDEAMIRRLYALGYERIEKLFNRFCVYTNDEIAYLKEKGVMLKGGI